VPRFELIVTVLSGLSGGLAGVLWNGLITAPWMERVAPTRSAGRTETVARLFAGAAIRGAAGAVLGLLFWLGWGLIAVVNVPWYVTGLIYGAVCWSALAAPVLATIGLHRGAAAAVPAAYALEWLFTCLVTGLLCALSWHRYA
jgi:hypothetical protein